jgi:Uncharacterized Fe-S protein
MDNIEILKQKINEWGASACGFAYIGDCVPNKYKIMEYAISIIVRLSDAIINEIDDKPTHTYFQHYRAVNALIDNITLRTSLLLQDWGYLAMAVPASQTVKTAEDPYTGIFQHKTAARLSGLGWIGKNALFISPDFGPRVRLGTIITNMSLPLPGSLQIRNCGSCNICRDSCPAGAIYGHNWAEGMPRSELINAERCSVFMKEKFKQIGRGSVCGVCMKVCPSGSRIIR